MTTNRTLRPVPRTYIDRATMTTKVSDRPVDYYQVIVDGEHIASISGTDLYGWNIVETASTFDTQRSMWRRGLDAIGMTGRWFPRNADKLELARTIADAHAAANREEEYPTEANSPAGW